MANIMSVLEKYKLVEKENDEFLLTSVEEELALEEAPQEEIIEPLPPVTTSTLPDSFADSIPVSLDEIYTAHNLANLPVTETVFILENFVNALPADLPEFVKKTTVDNILAASSMDVHKLLEDGSMRISHLQEFIHVQNTEISQDIATLKQTINKLSAIINEHQQKIKSKELLLQGQSTMIHNEIQRVNHIIKFFSA